MKRLEPQVRAWAAGKSWLVRAPLLAWLVWLLLHYWGDRTYLSIWHGINLGFHEAGHALFSPFGWLLGVAGGTILEVLIPVIAGYMLYRQQRDWFGVGVAACWLGIVCFETATYAGDARTLALPLVSPFGDPGPAGHDWANLLGHFRVLRHTAKVAAAWELAGRVIMTGGVVFGGWVLWVMARAGTPAEAELTPGERRLLESVRPPRG